MSSSSSAPAAPVLSVADQKTLDAVLTDAMARHRFDVTDKILFRRLVRAEPRAFVENWVLKHSAARGLLWSTPSAVAAATPPHPQEALLTRVEALLEQPPRWTLLDEARALWATEAAARAALPVWLRDTYEELFEAAIAKGIGNMNKSRERQASAARKAADQGNYVTALAAVDALLEYPRLATREADETKYREEYLRDRERYAAKVPSAAPLSAHWAIPQDEDALEARVNYWLAGKEVFRAYEVLAAYDEAHSPATDRRRALAAAIQAVAKDAEQLARVRVRAQLRADLPNWAIVNRDVARVLSYKGTWPGRIRAWWEATQDEAAARQQAPRAGDSAVAPPLDPHNVHAGMMFKRRVYEDKQAKQAAANAAAAAAAPAAAAATQSEQRQRQYEQQQELQQRQYEQQQQLRRQQFQQQQQQLDLQQQQLVTQRQKLQEQEKSMAPAQFRQQQQQLQLQQQELDLQRQRLQPQPGTVAATAVDPAQVEERRQIEQQRVEQGKRRVEAESQLVREQLQRLEAEEKATTDAIAKDPATASTHVAAQRMQKDLRLRLEAKKKKNEEEQVYWRDEAVLRQLYDQHAAAKAFLLASKRAEFLEQLRAFDDTAATLPPGTHRTKAAGLRLALRIAMGTAEFRGALKGNHPNHAREIHYMLTQELQALGQSMPHEDKAFFNQVLAQMPRWEPSVKEGVYRVMAETPYAPGGTAELPPNSPRELVEYDELWRTGRQAEATVFAVRTCTTEASAPLAVKRALRARHEARMAEVREYRQFLRLNLIPVTSGLPASGLSMRQLQAALKAATRLGALQLALPEEVAWARQMAPHIQARLSRLQQHNQDHQSLVMPPGYTPFASLGLEAEAEEEEEEDEEEEEEDEEVAVLRSAKGRPAPPSGEAGEAAAAAARPAKRSTGPHAAGPEVAHYVELLGQQRYAAAEEYAEKQCQALGESHPAYREWRTRVEIAGALVRRAE